MTRNDSTKTHHALVLKISASQNDASARLNEAGGELLLGALLNRGAQPNELVHPSFRLDARVSFKIVERRSADGARDNLSLIEHGELNNHSIEVVAQNLTLLQRHCKSSVTGRRGRQVEIVSNSCLSASFPDLLAATMV
jgi:hypothetical protein